MIIYSWVHVLLSFICRYYYKNFYSLGKRPPEPELPVRASGTPRVNCDEYEKGSCRWYDEWNYEHLVDYRNQRINLK